MAAGAEILRGINYPDYPKRSAPPGELYLVRRPAKGITTV
jgi:hypothetical protein